MKPAQSVTRLSVTTARSERGAGLVEFALIFVFFMVFVAGIVDFGRGYKIYQNITNATRETARLSAVPYYNQPTIPPNVLRDRLVSYLGQLGLDASYYHGFPQQISGTTAWAYGNYPNGAYLLINQRQRFNQVGGSGMVYTGSEVQLRYPYSYVFFSRFIGLISPGASYSSSIFLQNRSIIQNE